jgi:hypothetical protein
MGRFSEMQSTGAISASDCLFLGSDRQLFIEKTHPDSGKRPFQPRIGDLNAFMGREMTTFSNDTAADIRKYGLESRVTGHPIRRRSRDPARRRSGPVGKPDPAAPAGAEMRKNRKFFGQEEKNPVRESYEEMNP